MSHHHLLLGALIGVTGLTVMVLVDARRMGAWAAVRLHFCNWLKNTFLVFLILLLNEWLRS